ncbi:MAG: hypothetical protein LBI29_03775 [Rickettsiales bacterium]|jgi:hypothetical protein|nr:hypothetical protein [Rickettsiales bacterium]
MAKDSDNFINELKFDDLKENTKKFLLKYYKYIIAMVLALTIFFTVRFSVKNIERNRIEKYNERIFLSMASENPGVELEKIYGDKSIPSISKTFGGLSLVGEYTKNHQNEKVIEIYEEIFGRENDVYLKYYVGLNLLITRLNEENPNIERIGELFSKLESKDNPLINLVIEQKALFFIKQKKYDQAVEAIRNLMKRSDVDNNFRERLDRYLDFSQRQLRQLRRF